MLSCDARLLQKLSELEPQSRPDSITPLYEAKDQVMRPLFTWSQTSAFRLVIPGLSTLEPHYQSLIGQLDDFFRGKDCSKGTVAALSIFAERFKLWIFENVSASPLVIPDLQWWRRYLLIFATDKNLLPRESWFTYNAFYAVLDKCVQIIDTILEALLQVSVSPSEYLLALKQELITIDRRLATLLYLYGRRDRNPQVEDDELLLPAGPSPNALNNSCSDTLLRFVLVAEADCVNEELGETFELELGKRKKLGIHKLPVSESENFHVERVKSSIRALQQSSNKSESQSGVCLKLSPLAMIFKLYRLRAWIFAQINFFQEVLSVSERWSVVVFSPVYRPFVLWSIGQVLPFLLQKLDKYVTIINNVYAVPPPGTVQGPLRDQVLDLLIQCQNSSKNTHHILLALKKLFTTNQQDLSSDLAEACVTSDYRSRLRLLQTLFSTRLSFDKETQSIVNQLCGEADDTNCTLSAHEEDKPAVSVHLSSEVPSSNSYLSRELASWTVDEVFQWVDSFPMFKNVANQFRENRIGGEELEGLAVDVLIGFGLTQGAADIFMKKLQAELSKDSTESLCSLPPKDAFNALFQHGRLFPHLNLIPTSYTATANLSSVVHASSRDAQFKIVLYDGSLYVHLASKSEQVEVPEALQRVLDDLDPLLLRIGTISVTSAVIFVGVRMAGVWAHHCTVRCSNSIKKKHPCIYSVAFGYSNPLFQLKSGDALEKQLLVLVPSAGLNSPDLSKLQTYGKLNKSQVASMPLDGRSIFETHRIGIPTLAIFETLLKNYRQASSNEIKSFKLNDYIPFAQQTGSLAMKVVDRSNAVGQSEIIQRFNLVFTGKNLDLCDLETTVTFYDIHKRNILAAKGAVRYRTKTQLRVEVETFNSVQPVENIKFASIDLQIDKREPTLTAITLEEKASTLPSVFHGMKNQLLYVPLYRAILESTYSTTPSSVEDHRLYKATSELMRMFKGLKVSNKLKHEVCELQAVLDVLNKEHTADKKLQAVLDALKKEHAADKETKEFETKVALQKRLESHTLAIAQICNWDAVGRDTPLFAFMGGLALGGGALVLTLGSGGVAAPVVAVAAFLAASISLYDHRNKYNADGIVTTYKALLDAFLKQVDSTKTPSPLADVSDLELEFLQEADKAVLNNIKPLELCIQEETKALMWQPWLVRRIASSWAEFHGFVSQVWELRVMLMNSVFISFEGKKGSGKSEMQHALWGANIPRGHSAKTVRLHITPVACEDKSADLSSSAALSVSAVDFPGWGEASQLASVKADLFQGVSSLVVICIADREVDEPTFIHLRDTIYECRINRRPFVILLTKIDLSFFQPSFGDLAQKKKTLEDDFHQFLKASVDTSDASRELKDFPLSSKLYFVSIYNTHSDGMKHSAEHAKRMQDADVLLLEDVRKLLCKELRSVLHQDPLGVLALPGSSRRCELDTCDYCWATSSD